MAQGRAAVGEKMRATFKGREGQTFGRAEIARMVVADYPEVKLGSVLASDHAYNMMNDGVTRVAWRPIFERVSRGRFKCLGPGYAYSGPVEATPWGGRGTFVVGQWRDGKVTWAMGLSGGV